MADVGGAIEVRGVGQRARSGGETLRDVSLSVGHGELVVILGGSDSGMSALLEVMGGVRPPMAGEVDWGLGCDGNIGYVANGETLPSVLPLARALGYAAALRGLPGTAAGEALAATGLAGRADVPVGELTPAERRRAWMAAGLLGGPGLFCLDEPASGLDPAGTAEVLRLLRDLAAAGTTVVLTAHHPADAERADKVAVLAGGHLAFFGRPEAARDYFGADGMDEICERLAGVGDPASAWSRRYSRIPRTDHRVSPFFPAPRAAAPNGHHPDVPSARHPRLGPRPDEWRMRPGGGGSGGAGPRGHPSAFRQWAVLAARDVDVLARGGRRTAVPLAGPPLAALVVLAVLFRAGGAGAPLLWIAFSGFLTGLGWGVLPERPSLRHERLSAGPYLLAKVAVLLPSIAAADAVFLALIGLAGGWPGFAGYGPVYLTLLLCSAATLGLGLLVSAAVPPRRAAAVLPAGLFPLLLAAFGVARGNAGWPDWLLGACAVVLPAAAIIVLARSER